MSETIIRLASGYTLRTVPGETVRLCGPDGTEMERWELVDHHLTGTVLLSMVLGAAAGTQHQPADNPDSVKRPVYEHVSDAPDIDAYVDHVVDLLGDGQHEDTDEPTTDSVKPSIREGLIDLWFECRPTRERNPETLAVASGWADDVITSKWEDEPATTEAAVLEALDAAGEAWRAENAERATPVVWHDTLDTIEEMLNNMDRDDRNDAVEALRSRFEEIYDRDGGEPQQ